MNDKKSVAKTVVVLHNGEINRDHFGNLPVQIIFTNTIQQAESVLHRVDVVSDCIVFAIGSVDNPWVDELYEYYETMGRQVPPLIPVVQSRGDLRAISLYMQGLTYQPAELFSLKTRLSQVLGIREFPYQQELFKLPAQSV